MSLKSAIYLPHSHRVSYYLCLSYDCKVICFDEKVE